MYKFRLIAIKPLENFRSMSFSTTVFRKKVIKIYLLRFQHSLKYVMYD